MCAVWLRGEGDARCPAERAGWTGHRVDEASSEQQKQVLLEARVSRPGNPRFSAAFHQQLTVNLARALRDELACTNKPDIPDDLQLSK